MADRKTIWNFGKNVRLEPKYLYQPGSYSELLKILDQHRDDQIRAIGSLHAWSEAAQSSDVVIEMKHFESVEIDADAETVTVGAGCQIKQVLKQLADSGLTLPSVGLIDEQTVAGATATATHGSGNNSLSHFITAVEIAHFDNQTGEPTLTMIDSGVELAAARCAIGLLGIATRITLRCRPKYNIQEHAAAHESLPAVLEHETDYPLQQFYLMPWLWVYFGHHRVESERQRGKLATLYRWYCFLVIDVGLHVAMFVLAKLLKQAWATRFFFKHVLPLTIVRKWTVIDDSHAMLTMEHELFRHIEIEVFVQRSNLQATTDFLIDVVNWCSGAPMKDQARMQNSISQLDCQSEFDDLHGCYVHHYPICYRRILCDDALLSMAAASNESTEDWYAISFISYQWPNDRNGFFQFANFIGLAVAQLFAGRCHWGKYNPLEKSDNRQLYPRMEEFRDIVHQYDSKGTFKNDWLENVL